MEAVICPAIAPFEINSTQLSGALRPKRLPKTLRGAGPRGVGSVYHLHTATIKPRNRIIMFKKILITTCIITSFSTSSAFAAPSTLSSQAKEGFGVSVEDGVERQARSAVITQIMAASGMDEIMEQLPAMVAMGMDQSPPPPVESDVLEKFRATVLQSFDPTRTRPMLVRFFEQRYDNRRYAEKWRCWIRRFPSA